MIGFLHAGRSAVRRLKRRPGATVAIALTLALGVGVLTAVFQIRRAVLRPLPYPRPEELVHALEESPRDPGQPVSAAPADVLAWQAGARSFTALGAYMPFGSADVLLD